MVRCFLGLNCTEFVMALKTSYQNSFADFSLNLLLHNQSQWNH